MDAQMKRGFLEACVLATLQRRESYGYQIIKDVPVSLGLTESSLYPLLKRLQGGGLIAVRSAEHNGRLRKYYRITAAGQERLQAFLVERDEVVGLYRYVEESMVAPASGESAAGDVVSGAGASGDTGDEAALRGASSPSGGRRASGSAPASTPGVAAASSSAAPSPVFGADATRAAGAPTPA